MSRYLDVFSLSGKVSLVTGAGRGIGFGTAKALAGAGSDLIIAGRTVEQLETAKESLINETGRRVEAVVVDLSRPDGPDRLVTKALSLFGRIDILVNNAGSNIRKPLLEVSPADFETVMQIQLKSVFFLSQMVAKEMIKIGGGKIINLGSLTSKIAVSGISVYGAAKGGIFALTKSLAVELAPHNINVNAVAPGYVRTTMTEPAFQDKDRYDWMLSRIPLARFGTPEDIGNTALFLASPAADYLTGEMIYVDGGWMAA